VNARKEILIRINVDIKAFLQEDVDKAKEECDQAKALKEK
jgi:hypothetical protein